MHVGLVQGIHEMMSCKTLQALLDTARTMLRSPLILADLSFHVLALTEQPDITDPRWIQISKERTLPLNIVNVGLYQASRQNQGPVLSTDSTNLTIVRSAVSSEGKLIGYLLCPGYGGVPTQEELDVLQVLTDLCSLKMQKELHYGEYPEDMLEFFLSDLLNGTITEEEKILDRCRFFHWDLKLPYRILAIRPDTDEPDSGALYLKLGEIRAALSQRFPEATAFLYGNQVKLVLRVYGQVARDAIIRGEVEQFLRERGLRAGVSQMAYHLRSMARRHQQAMKALELGQLLRSRDTLFLYDRYSIYHCLELCASQINLLQCCHSAVIMLEDYDRKNGTELLETLHAYLVGHRKLAEAAASLYIHRNTLSRRLEKISDLVHVDFEDDETVFHLMFSFRIMEYYGMTEMRDSYENWVERSPTLRHP